MEKEIKVVDASSLKAVDGERGVIEGWLAHYSNVDRQGDVIEPGAFKDNPSPIPVFGLHDPSQAIGVGYVEERQSKGLWIQAHLAVDDEDSDVLRDRAREYYALGRRGIIKSWSVGMFIGDAKHVKKKTGGTERTVRSIRQAEAVEGSMVAIPANALAAIVSVKSAGETLPDLLARLDRIEGLEAERAEAKAAMAEANAELLERVDHRINELEIRHAIHEREQAEKQARLAEVREEAAHEYMWQTYGRNWQDNPVARAVWGKLYSKGLVGSAEIPRYWAA